MEAKKRKVSASSSSTSAPEDYTYLAGYAGAHQSEALKGALPEVQNTPQKCPYGLYAEQLSGTSFTSPRKENQRSWLYRIQPSVAHTAYEKVEDPAYGRMCLPWDISTPEQIRWDPFPLADTETATDFVQGMVCYGGSGDPAMRAGFAVYVYSANRSMEASSFTDSDADLLIVPQQGVHDIVTEFGKMLVKPGEICIIPRGIKFAVLMQGDIPLRGYCCEPFDGHFVIPDGGPIGANGLASERHFLVPTATYDDSKFEDNSFQNYHKFNHTLWKYTTDHSVFDVVAWHGNYHPCKYDLAKYCVINSVSFDHMAPSIFTVLTCGTGKPGVAAVDFVIFPPRWSVAENTFRPPFYHRNVMSEFMGLIHGQYEAKKEGFQPGGGSLHSCMAGHGPDHECFVKATEGELKAERVADGTMSFMFESYYMMKLTSFAYENLRQKNYNDCWKSLKPHFTPEQK